ncbi:LacI family transcriptional regulator [Homoserinimonas aerilata]|uniref:LacI family transcriptional regulator n=1 Tax=Homoserinimonas aerilata TaxID=1162970 RepID=A0A542YGY7_9MICO|nr:LacI family DNA-binding transcriptional regulator [Homoserinimonas aerilata]TQL47244.1 LacI family transcriptional regulator [Homoserinimonas aerilata]
MATTIRQIASAAGVSVATASRALNGAPSVVDRTRERVLAAAALLDYTPSRLGRSLATGSTGNVGVILPDVTNPFYTSFLAELESVLGAHDRGILVGDSHESSEQERALIRRMSGQVDALVLASSRLPDADIVAAAARLPVVLANRLLDGDAGDRLELPERLAQITLDIEPAFAEAVRHLHALGHRSVAYLDGPPQSWSGRQKMRSLERACRELRMPLAVAATATPDFVGGRRALASIDLTHTTAIIAFNDEIALGLLSALRDAGVEVPARMSVIGCDDSLPEGLAWPSLTTVDSSARTLGALTAAAIVEPKPHHTATVPTRLVVRDSTAEASVLS